MSARRIAAITAAIAIVPGLVWLLLLAVITDPDEGANIGGGFIGLGVIMGSWVAAVVFLGAALVQKYQERRARNQGPVR